MKNRFTPEFFSGNRARLCGALPGHLIVVAAHSLLQESADTAFPFRQDSNFWYLTGVNEPDLLLVIDTDSGESTILLPERSDYQDEWDGVLSKNAIKKVSGVSEIRFKADLKRILKNASKKNQKIGYLAPPADRVEPYGFYANPSRKNLESLLLEGGVLKMDDLADVRMELAKLRMVKQPVEIAAIQRAIDITAATLADVKSRMEEFDTEKDLERAITAGFFERGAGGHAYQPIVASGKNAATIHYTANCKKLANCGMVLLDVGAKVDGYAADISRTWALGDPSEREKEVFEAVVNLQQKGIAMLKPGVKIRDYQKTMEKEAEKVFKKLKCSMAGKPFPHGFSHHLGLDVHDAADYDAPLVEGCVLTVEPGIYLSDEGSGVRIEDNILITKNGNKNLSANIPKVL